MSTPQTTDVLSRKYATGADADAMDACPSYDYTRQVWLTHSDHAHMTSDTSPLLFCGADLQTCRGMTQDYAPADDTQGCLNYAQELAREIAQ